jgi:PqqD family protein of HPr-rel-A system
LRWRSLPPESLAWRDFDGEIVVRNARTGSTHHLEALASEVFRALLESQAPLSVADLEALLREGTEVEDNGAEWAAPIQEVLTQFERLGLAEARAD